MQVPFEDLKKAIEGYILQNINYDIILYITEDMSFGEYFKIVEAINGAVNTIRDQAALKGYAINYKNLSQKQQQIIKKRLPLRFLEVTKHDTLKKQRE